MRVVPRTLNGKISFYSSHLPKWALDPAAIGSTPEEIADLQDKLDAARDAFKQQRQAQNAARAATGRLQSAVDALTNAGGSAILRVRSKARNDGTPVYAAAQIRLPKKGSPIAAPGKPTSFKWELGSLGELKPTWKCKNPRGSQGTMYQIHRRLGSEGPLQYLGGTGKKQFVDTTLPPGTAMAIYQVQATRSTTKGALADCTVNFGVSESDAHLLKLSARAARGARAA